MADEYLKAALYGIRAFNEKTKEKVGMMKLIELLNEFEKHRSLGGLADWREFDGNLHYYSNYKDEYVFDNVYYLIISKNYGFIKWLVENEKIKPLRKFIGWETDEDEPYIQFDLVDQYIAYLSIQDEPIEFLVSILK